MTPHNEAKKGDIAKTVLMPGDPMRAKYIADNFLTDVKLVNSVRGMYAYTGKYKNKKVTVMASGMGMPSIGIYSYELYKFYDVENIIRIGSAGAYTKDLSLYDIVLVSESYSESSFAKVQGYNENIIKSSEYINNKIKDVNNKIKDVNNKIKDVNNNIIEGRVHSTDVFYNDTDIKDLYNNKKCLCAEMESFGLFYIAKKLGKQASCLLTISDNLETKEETTSSERQTAFNEMIKLSLEVAIIL